MVTYSLESDFPYLFFNFTFCYLPQYTNEGNTAYKVWLSYEAGKGEEIEEKWKFSTTCIHVFWILVAPAVLKYMGYLVHSE